MLTKRIIACLDVKEGRTVKGVNFKNLRDTGDPVALARRYSNEGIDELVFLDISATQERRSTMLHWVEQVAKAIQIPFCVGGGVKDVEGARALLRAGADKVAINSAAILRPDVLEELSSELGEQCVVLAVDAKYEDSKWSVYRSGGSMKTNLTLKEWCKEGVSKGVGEILFTSMDHDGTQQGFALEALKELSNQCSVPIIASGGGGSIKDFRNLFTQTEVSAGLAASIFHDAKIEIPYLKSELHKSGLPIRLSL